MQTNLTKSDAAQIAALIRQTESLGFRESLMTFVRARFCCNSFLLLSYAKHQLPAAHFTWIEDEALDAIYRAQYLTGAYRLDPFYQHSIRSGKDGAYRLKAIAPDRFFASEYYKRYYRLTGIGDELALITKQSNGTATHISISRHIRNGAYTRAELDRWNTLAPILTTLLHDHGEKTLLAGVKPQDQVETKDTVELIRNFTQSRFDNPLTQREAQIAAMVLEGHSSGSASAVLELSSATVKVHRRNIYRKLGISSQAELFATLHRALATNL